MLGKQKKLLKEKGILESPNQKPGKTLSNKIVGNIQAFNESDEISRVMPGKKDCVTIKTENGAKYVTSKRLILGNLKEI